MSVQILKDITTVFGANTKARSSKRPRETITTTTNITTSTTATTTETSATATATNQLPKDLRLRRIYSSLYRLIPDGVPKGGDKESKTLFIFKVKVFVLKDKSRN